MEQVDRLKDYKINMDYIDKTLDDSKKITAEASNI